MFTSPFGLSKSDKYMAGQLYCELNSLCRKCGSSEHFIGNCNSTGVEDWVHNFGGTLDLKGEDDFGRKCSNCSKDISEPLNTSGSVANATQAGLKFENFYQPY